MSRPASRVLALLEIMQDCGLGVADELARCLDVDARAVRRYIALRDMDVPVASVRGRYDGYRLARGVCLPPMMLADDELVAVRVALATGKQYEQVGEPGPTGWALVKLPPPARAAAPAGHRVDRRHLGDGRPADP